MLPSHEQTQGKAGHALIRRFATRLAFLPAMLMITTLFITACASNTQRSAGTVIDDQTLEYSVINRIYSDKHFSEDDHIKVEVKQGVVLLVGETVSEENKTLATQLAEKDKLTKRVVNDILVGNETGFTGRLDNSWLTTKVTTILVKENPLPGNDAGRIKVVSSQNTVYLMGLVTREEADAVTDIVRNIGGVEKVVKVFDYSD